MVTVEWINCPAPLPEDPATALLTEVLLPAPYKVLEKKAENKATGTRRGLQRKATPDASSEDEGEGEEIPPLTREEKKRKAAHLGRPKGPRRRPRGPGKVSGTGP